MAPTTDALDIAPGEQELLNADRRVIPGSWARLGEARTLDGDGDWFYAVEICVERYERRVRESATEVDISERCWIFARYSTADGERALQARYQGAMIEEVDGVGVVPKAAHPGNTGTFWSRIRCAEPGAYELAAPSKPDDAAQVRALYDLESDPETDTEAE